MFKLLPLAQTQLLKCSERNFEKIKNALPVGYDRGRLDKLLNLGLLKDEF